MRMHVLMTVFGVMCSIFFGIVGLGKIMLIFSNYDLDHTANLST